MSEGGVLSGVQSADDARLHAMATNDWPALERLLHDELTYTHSVGQTHSKPQLLEFFSTRLRYTGVRREEAKVRELGDVGLMTGVLVSEFAFDGRPASTRTKFLSVWQRMADGWKLLAWQATAAKA